MDLDDPNASSTVVVDQPGGDAYVPPRLERLGTLAELTLGGESGPDDGFGGAGDEGSV
jgi:hypothetical protein